MNPSNEADDEIVGKLGYYLPVSLVGAVLIAIGNGLLSTFDPNTSTGKWIGYQILVGAGQGGALQMVCFALFSSFLFLPSYADHDC